MPLLDHTGQIVDDPWQVHEEGTDLPASGELIYSADNIPASPQGRIGVTLTNDVDPFSLSLDVGRLSLIVLNFPSFADGRAYSQARVLREHLGFSGNLRATGHLLPDQVAFMVEAGFDSFELATDRFPLERWAEALKDVTLTYHRHLSRPGQSPVIAARHGG